MKKLRPRKVKDLAQSQQLANDRDRFQTQAVYLQAQHSFNYYTIVPLTLWFSDMKLWIEHIVIIPPQTIM